MSNREILISNIDSMIQKRVQKEGYVNIDAMYIQVSSRFIHENHPKFAQFLASVHRLKEIILVLPEIDN